MKTLVKKKFIQLFSFGRRAFQNIVKNKKMAILVFVNLLFIGLILYAKPALAGDGDGTIAQIGDYIGTLITQIFMGLSEFFIKMALFFLQYFIVIAGWNDYLDVPTVMLGWTMVRDVANMFFVVILLVIAFGTILGIEQYQWNKLLVKLILCAIFINFSNLICGIFIDIAHVFTITFVNAVSATAGGNFIQAFKLAHLQKIVVGKELDGSSDFQIHLLVGALAAMLFAIVAMCIIAAYAIVMLARMIVLWVLVILSPLAFILQVLPNTQSYAKQWWDKFAKQVLVAPIMVFFLWLTFATAGSGNIATEIELNIKERPGEAMPATSLSESTTWGNMASFFIPLALMMAGIGVVQQMGVVGGGVVQSAMGVAKKIAGYATGYNAARWTGAKAKDLSKKGAIGLAKKVAMTAPVIGGRNWRRLGARMSARIKETPYLRHLPFVGVGGEYHEKLDKRVKDRAENEKTARLAELSYADELVTKIPGVGKVLGKFGGLRKSSELKTKSEERMQSALAQKEVKTAMKKERTEEQFRAKGEAHINRVELDQADLWAQENGLTFADGKEKVNAYREASLDDKKLRDKFERALSKPVKGLVYVDVKTGKKTKADFANSLNARNSALQTYFGRKKATYSAGKEKRKEDMDVQLASTALGQAELGKMALAQLENYGEEEVKQITTRMSQALLEAGREELKAAIRSGNLEELLESNDLIRSIYIAEQSKIDTLTKTGALEELSSDVSAVAIDPKLRGFSTTSGTAGRFAESFKGPLTSMGEGERGDAVSDNIIMIAGQKRRGIKTSRDQMYHLYASLMSAAEHGNVDDSVSSLAIKANLLDDFEELNTHHGGNEALIRADLESKDYSNKQIDQILNADFRDDLGAGIDLATENNWIRQQKNDKTGKTEWTDSGDDKSMPSYVTYMMTGGDDELVRKSREIGQIQDSTGVSFQEASKTYFSNPANMRAGDKLTSLQGFTNSNGDYQEGFLDRYADHQDLLKEGTEKLKDISKRTGHTQYGTGTGHDSKLGMIRMNSYKEKLHEMSTAVLKDRNTHANPQGFGHYDNIHAEQIYILMKKVLDHTLSKAPNANALERIADDRMLTTVLLGGNRDEGIKKSDDGYAQIGGGKATRDRRGYGDSDVGTYLTLLKNLAPVLITAGNKVSMAAAIKTGQDRIAAERGDAKMEVMGTSIKGDNIDDVMDQIVHHLETEKLGIFTKLNLKLANARGAGDNSLADQIQADIDRITSNSGDNNFDEIIDGLKRVSGSGHGGPGPTPTPGPTPAGGGPGPTPTPGPTPAGGGPGPTPAPTPHPTGGGPGPSPTPTPGGSGTGGGEPTSEPESKDKESEAKKVEFASPQELVSLLGEISDTLKSNLGGLGSSLQKAIEDLGSNLSEFSNDQSSSDNSGLSDLGDELKNIIKKTKTTPKEDVREDLIGAFNGFYNNLINIVKPAEGKRDFKLGTKDEKKEEARGVLLRISLDKIRTNLDNLAKAYNELPKKIKPKRDKRKRKEAPPLTAEELARRAEDDEENL